jgi:hypothetical protein
MHETSSLSVFLQLKRIGAEPVFLKGNIILIRKFVRLKMRVNFLETILLLVAPVFCASLASHEQQKFLGNDKSGFETVIKA